MRIAARKRFGQHFLHDAAVLHQIKHAVAPRPCDHVVEIGPGQGALTQLLLPSAHQLHAVEIDRDLVNYLHHHFQENNLHIHQADILSFDLARCATDNRKLRVVGNLPYNISTALLFKLFKQIPLIEDMHFMLQQEVVTRLTAQIGDSAYSRLSVMTQYYCDTEYLFTVEPQAFTPPPKVYSAVVRLTPLQRDCPARSIPTFTTVVKTAFGQRRKTIRHTLAPLITADALIHLGIDPTVRPQQLSVTDFIRISNQLPHVLY